jgi:tetratricopeptide (TPR) repeat protein
VIFAASQKIGKQNLIKQTIQTMTNLLKRTLFLLAVVYAPQLFAQSYQDGMTAMQYAKWDDAVNIFTSVTKADPQNQDAWLSLGAAYMAKGDKAGAKAACDGLLQNNSGGSRGFIANARVKMMQNDMAEADKQLDKATRAGKKDAVAFRHIGESFLYVGEKEKPNFTRALDYLKKSYNINSKDFNTLMTLGFAYKLQGNGGDAAQYYEFASLQQPKNPMPYYLTGRVYYIAKLMPKAVEYYDRAIAVDPTYDRALRAKAEYLYFDSKDYEEAVKTYSNLVSKGANVTIDDQMGYANTLFLTRDYPGCIQQVEKVISIDPTKTYLRRLLGYCYFENGEYQKGLDVMNDYFEKVSPDKILPSDYLYLANLKIQTGGDTLNAIENLHTMIEMDPTRWATYKTIGDLHYKMRDYCSANKAYRMRLDSLGDETTATDYYYIGLTRYYCTEDSDSIRYSKALAAFAKVAEMAPTSATGWEWASKAASKLEPDLQADTTQAAADAFGVAQPYFEKYLEVTVDETKQSLVDNRIDAMEYLCYYYFVKKNNTKALAIIEDLLKADPENPTGNELKKVIMGEEPDPGNGK